MSAQNTTVVLAAVIVRGIAVSVALAGAAWLAHDGKDGWGWLIFAALAIGCADVTGATS